MEPLQSIISQIDSLVWGPVMLVLLMGTGLFLSIRTRFLGPRNLFFALKKPDNPAAVPEIFRLFPP